MRYWLCLAGALGALAVLCGAFAAHGLAARLSAAQLQMFETAARYHMYHALAIGLAALAMRGEAAAKAQLAAACFLAGIILFSGSLYMMALNPIMPGAPALGYITPLGGIAFVAGWIGLALAALRLPRS